MADYARGDGRAADQRAVLADMLRRWAQRIEDGGVITDASYSFESPVGEVGSEGLAQQYRHTGRYRITVEWVDWDKLVEYFHDGGSF